MNTDMDVLWALTGGYGSARLIPSFANLPPPPRPKLFIGYSDMTALQLFFSQKWGWQTIHGAMFNELLDPEKDPRNFADIATIIAGTLAQMQYPITSRNAAAQGNAIIRGLVTGGNLAVVESSIGTSWQIDTKHKVVFLEDSGSKGYQVDRSLNHLVQAGISTMPMPSSSETFAAVTNMSILR